MDFPVCIASIAPSTSRSAYNITAKTCPNYPQHPRRSTRKADIETYFEYVYLQTWASGPSRAYWIVERDGRLVRPAVPVGSIRGLVSSGQDSSRQLQLRFSTLPPV
ncbi:hypothetical protein QL093DRAFT_2371079, partial [Fusarium oxysporum]